MPQWENYGFPMRKVALNPNHPDHGGYGQPWLVTPDLGSYPTDDPIWTVWEESPPGDQDHQWVPAEDVPFDLTADEARERL